MRLFVQTSDGGSVSCTAGMGEPGQESSGPAIRVRCLRIIWVRGSVGVGLVPVQMVGGLLGTIHSNEGAGPNCDGLCSVGQALA